MGCPEENVIVDFARGELTKAERATVEAHIDECGACSQLVAEMARIFADDLRDSGSKPAFPELSRPSQATLATDGAFSPSGATLGNSRNSPEQVLPQGAKLGRYVVIDRVGAGGMGIVYAAYDPELDRKVALKVLRSALKKHAGRNDQRARLIREAQAMAKLSHPNVITVHDVGTFEGQVFLAMEFIEGGTLGQWLSKKRRSWREILTVFRAAGEGLQSAHEGGLVHRDFKPDNVLMGTDGRVLVTDFGLARPAAGNTGRFDSVGSSPSGQALLQASLTQTGALVGTPAYMAPEQLRAKATDALTDQFSFCVTLYEALYGERPFQGHTLVELVHNVTAGNIRPVPRDAAVPRWLRRAVQRGLQIEAKDRYPSMHGLLVALRRDPWRQWRRWGTVAAPTVLLGFGILAYQQVEQSGGDSYCNRVHEMLDGVWDKPRQQAIERAFVATSRPYAQDVFDTTKTTLDQYATAWSAMQTQACLDEVAAEQPRAVLALRMGCLSRRLGSLEVITELLVTADSDTVAAAADAARGLPTLDVCTDLEALTERVEMIRSPEAREAATAVDRLAVRANVLLSAAKTRKAKALAESMIADSQASGYRRGEAQGLYTLGMAQLALNQRDQAETSFHRALSAALAAGHSEVMAKASVGLVWIAGSQGRNLDESERWAAHGLAALEQVTGTRPLTSAKLYHALGVARHKAGKLDGADDAFNLGLASLDHAGPEQDRGRAALLASKATVMLTRGRHEEALATFAMASEVIRTAYGDRHPHMATILDNRGSALSQLGREDEALALQQAALDIRTDAFGDIHAMVGGSHQNISITLVKMGDLDGALQHANVSVEVMRAALGEQSLEVVGALMQRAYVLDALKRHEEAISVLDEALAISVATSSSDHPRTVSVRFQLGWALSRTEDLARAQDLLGAVLPELAAVHGEESTKFAEANRKLADVTVSLGQPTKAVKLAELALRIALANDAHEETADTRFVLARALVELPAPDKSRALKLADQARAYFTDRDPDRATRVWAWMAEHS